MRARDRGVESGNTRSCLPRQRARARRPLRAGARAVRSRGIGQRAQRLDRDEALDPFRAPRPRGCWRCPRPSNARAAAKRSQPSASATSSTALHRAGERVVGARRQVRAAAVAGQVERDQVDVVQVRGQRHEAGGVVEPAMQREHARRAGVPPRSAGRCGRAAVSRRDLAHAAPRAHAPPARVAPSAASASACAGASLRQGM